MIKLTATTTAADAGAILSGFSWFKGATATTTAADAPSKPAAADAPATTTAPSKGKGVQAIVSEFIDNQFDDVDAPIIVNDIDLFSLTVDADA